jgi:hypothetical protein
VKYKYIVNPNKIFTVGVSGATPDGTIVRSYQDLMHDITNSFDISLSQAWLEGMLNDLGEQGYQLMDVERGIFVGESW